MWNHHFILASLISIPLAAMAQTQLEPLMGHVTNVEGVHIQVRSGGCTYKQQFTVEQDMVGDTHMIRFIRQKPDLCRAYFPYGEIITFSFDELGVQNGERVEIVNPEAPTQILRL